MADLIVDKLCKQYPTRGEPLVVLRDVSLAVSAGESLAVLGPSGSGKSTLLHILGTLDTPTSGSVSLDGTQPFQLDEPALAAFRNRNIGFVFQDHLLLPQLTVLENVLVPTLAHGRPSEPQQQRAVQLLERVGLAQRLDHRPAELSGGERQRAALARALILSPRLILADEPTGNLDRSTATAIGQLLRELPEIEPVMLIVVTHSLELASRMQRRWEIDGGRLSPVA
ncbi:MAG: ABC transporter ATP-binding protein [Pirellulales bacterium]